MIDLPNIKAQFHYDPETGEIRNRASSPFLLELPGTIGLFGIAPENSYYVIDDERFERIPEQPSEFHVWNWKLKEWDDPREFDYYREQKWLELKQARTNAIIAGFDVSGIGRFQSDLVSQKNIIGVSLSATRAQMTDAPWSVVWTLEDNSLVTLNAAQMIDVANIMDAHIQAQFGIGVMLRPAVQAAATCEELDAITWPAP